jgi:hypothetical protein
MFEQKYKESLAARERSKAYVIPGPLRPPRRRIIRKKNDDS